MEVDLGPDHIVLDGNPAAPEKGHTHNFRHSSPIFGLFLFWPNGWMDQDATNLGMEVGLGPGHIALDGDPVPPAKGAQPSNFRPVYAVAKHAPISAVAEHLFK